MRGAWPWPGTVAVLLADDKEGYPARVLTTLLYGTTPTDPLTFTLVALIVAIVAVLAAAIPARRATSIDPMIALRYE